MKQIFGLEVEDALVEVVGQSPYCTSKYLAKFLTWWGGFMNMWLDWMHHNLSPNHDRKRLQIVKLLLDR